MKETQTEEEDRQKDEIFLEVEILLLQHVYAQLVHDNYQKIRNSKTKNETGAKQAKHLPAAAYCVTVESTSSESDNLQGLHWYPSSHYVESNQQGFPSTLHEMFGIEGVREHHSEVLLHGGTLLFL